MKKLTLVMLICLLPNAFADVTLSCRDTRTFNYGRATVVNNHSGLVQVTLFANTLGAFLNKIDPANVSAGPNKIVLTFREAACKDLNVCSDDSVEMTYTDDNEQSRQIVASHVDVTVGVNGAGISVAKDGVSAQGGFGLNTCTTSGN